jgi:hypothetical protein
MATWREGEAPRPVAGGSSRAAPAGVDGPLPCHLADEVACVAAWLDARAGRRGAILPGAVPSNARMIVQ